MTELKTPTPLESKGEMLPMFEESDTWAFTSNSFKLFNLGNDRYICCYDENGMDLAEFEYFSKNMSEWLNVKSLIYVKYKKEESQPNFVELSKSIEFNQLVDVIVERVMEKAGFKLPVVSKPYIPTEDDMKLSFEKAKKWTK